MRRTSATFRLFGRTHLFLISPDLFVITDDVPQEDFGLWSLVVDNRLPELHGPAMSTECDRAADAVRQNIEPVEVTNEQLLSVDSITSRSEQDTDENLVAHRQTDRDTRRPEHILGHSQLVHGDRDLFGPTVFQDPPVDAQHEADERRKSEI